MNKPYKLYLANTKKSKSLLFQIFVNDVESTDFVLKPTRYVTMPNEETLIVNQEFWGNDEVYVADLLIFKTSWHCLPLTDYKHLRNIPSAPFPEHLGKCDI